MIDISQYRCQIGIFRQKAFNKKFLYKQEYYESASWNRNKSGENILCATKFILKFIVLSVLLSPPAWTTTSPPPHLDTTSCRTVQCADTTRLLASYLAPASTGYDWLVGGVGKRVISHAGGKVGNFWARYLNGNIMGVKGISNIHFNIRSLKFK